MAALGCMRNVAGSCGSELQVEEVVERGLDGLAILPFFRGQEAEPHERLNAALAEFYREAPIFILSMPLNVGARDGRGLNGGPFGFR